ncbi:MafI family immunity protein [Achromobacter insuavis]|uniref:MafI family immunity protein n=1 Tax=Achromobacter insuavis TaxID=1287735 RepID=UPI001F128EC3|nr:MafI family immunity protein [Achromobacter insuavis]
MYADKIISFGLKFNGRLDSALLQAALDYVGFGEKVLAFETLCDHIYEYDIPISQSEYEIAINLALGMDLSSEENRFRCLKELIK